MAINHIHQTYLPIRSMNMLANIPMMAGMFQVHMLEISRWSMVVTDEPGAPQCLGQGNSRSRAARAPRSQGPRATPCSMVEECGTHSFNVEWNMLDDYGKLYRNVV